MASRIVKISNPASLRYKNKAILVLQKGEEVSVPLEDIAVIVLECVQISLTSQLLSHCAAQGVVIITVGETYLPNGLFLPFLSHSRGLQVMKKQLALTLPRKKRLWQKIVQQKIVNQANVLKRYGYKDTWSRLTSLATAVRSGDSGNSEAIAAQLYFRTLFGTDFYRGQECFLNAAMNYGYSIVRSALARSLVAYGFQPSLGLHHHNEQNAFNLADDLIEPYRPLVDLKVVSLLENTPESQELKPAHKNTILAMLQENITLIDAEGIAGVFSLLSAVDMTTQSLGRCLRNVTTALTLPLLGEAESE